jgi:hypothetical protein
MTNLGLQTLHEKPSYTDHRDFKLPDHTSKFFRILPLARCPSSRLCFSAQHPSVRPKIQCYSCNACTSHNCLSAQIHRPPPPILPTTTQHFPAVRSVLSTLRGTVKQHDSIRINQKRIFACDCSAAIKNFLQAASMAVSTCGP